jgi:hypothetical protein
LIFCPDLVGIPLKAKDILPKLKEVKRKLSRKKTVIQRATAYSWVVKKHGILFPENVRVLQIRLFGRYRLRFMLVKFLFPGLKAGANDL